MRASRLWLARVMTPALLIIGADAAIATNWISYGRSGTAIQLDLDSVTSLEHRGVPLVAYANGKDAAGAELVIYVMGGDCQLNRGTLYIRRVPPSSAVGDNYPFDLKTDDLTTTQVDALAATLCHALPGAQAR